MNKRFTRRFKVSTREGRYSSATSVVCEPARMKLRDRNARATRVARSRYVFPERWLRRRWRGGRGTVLWDGTEPLTKRGRLARGGPGEPAAERPTARPPARRVAGAPRRASSRPL